MPVQQARISQSGSVTPTPRPYSLGGALSLILEQGRKLSGRGEDTDCDGHAGALDERPERTNGTLRSAREGEVGGDERG
jgi:hypothetical protein